MTFSLLIAASLHCMFSSSLNPLISNSFIDASVRPSSGKGNVQSPTS
uniref:Uncharacterized protein n=1 Tax=Arundo donax TaxID=35708 RepID=A0A0A8ZUG7_ARUDO